MIEHRLRELQRSKLLPLPQSGDEFSCAWSVPWVWSKQPEEQVHDLGRRSWFPWRQGVLSFTDRQRRGLSEGMPVEQQCIEDATEHPSVHCARDGKPHVHIYHLRWPVHHGCVLLDLFRESAQLL